MAARDNGGVLLLLSGASGSGKSTLELLAAPSATEVDGIAACLVDCDEDERLRRLRARDGGDVRRLTAGRAHAVIVALDPV
jgi:CO dehydrogenase nickel-insertion accessory protein CooC1